VLVLVDDCDRLAGSVAHGAAQTEDRYPVMFGPSEKVAVTARLAQANCVNVSTDVVTGGSSESSVIAIVPMAVAQEGEAVFVLVADSHDEGIV
jgi:hypothetical protein